MHTHTHTHTHTHLFKAAKDIVPGQEILVRYGDPAWFAAKNIPYSEVDYASTMWRPELHPLPCRQGVGHKVREGHSHTPTHTLTHAPTSTHVPTHPLTHSPTPPTTHSPSHTHPSPDGQHVFTVLNDIPIDTVVDISLCIDVALSVVDQFPMLWDFVLIGWTSKTVCVCVCVCACVCVYASMQKSAVNRYIHAIKYLCQSPRRCASLCPTPSRYRPLTTPTSLTCACHSIP